MKDTKIQPHQDQQVRGPALREQMIESEQYAEEYRSTHSEDDTQKTQSGHKKVPEKKVIETQ